MAMLRSQTDAPIELVIAIIILVSSLAIAMLLMNNITDQQCYSELRGEVQKLQLAMQDLALQSPPSSRKITFVMPSCGKAQIDVLRFVAYTKPEYCRACPGHFAGCWRVEMATFDNELGRYVQSTDLYNAGVCVDIAGDMDLIDETEIDPGKAGYCQVLGDSPCPTGNALDCTFDKSSVLKSAFDTSSEEAIKNSPSRWQTLGKEKRAYEITLRKTIATCRLGVEPTQCPAISICAHGLE